MHTRQVMRINADFGMRVAIHPDQWQWVASPVAGVERMMLDRIGDEKARATSFVRYAANSEFTRHIHTGGEEYLVLAGVFGDERGEYPAGFYVRNPIGTAHTPAIGPEGCLIFVKLWQFHPHDRTPVNTDMTGGVSEQTGPGSTRRLLHEFGTERVEIFRLSPGRTLAADNLPGGAEILVLAGSFSDDLGEWPRLSWQRLPPGASHSLTAGGNGAMLWRKTGHLPPDVPLPV